MKRLQVWRFEMADTKVVEVELIQTREEPTPLYELTLFPSESTGAYEAVARRGSRTYGGSGLAYTEATEAIGSCGRIKNVVEVPEEQFEPSECAELLRELRASVGAWKKQVGSLAAGVDPEAIWPELHDQIAASCLMLARNKRVAQSVRNSGQMLRQAIARFGNILVWERRRQCSRPGHPPRNGEYKWTMQYIQTVLDEVEAARRGVSLEEDAPQGQLIFLDDFRRRRQAV